MAERPWRTLRERPEIEFMLCDLPRGVRAIYATRDGNRAILISRDLTPAERLAALAHELKHDDRGGGCHEPAAPPLLRVAATREEARVDREVAVDLLPDEKLRPYVEARAGMLEMVVAYDVAEEFDVSIEVAHLSLERLAAGF